MIVIGIHTQHLFFIPLFRFTTQKMKFSIKDFLSKCVKKSLMKNFIFCVVIIPLREELHCKGKTNI